MDVIYCVDWKERRRDKERGEWENTGVWEGVDKLEGNLGENMSKR